MRPNYTLPRLYLDAPLSGEIALSKAHAHYLGTVLRKGEGERVRLFNARDGEWSAEVVSAAKRAMTVRVVERLREPHFVPDIRLLFAPIRKHRMSVVLEKATELGVRTLQPVITERTQFPKVNLERARAQIVEAAEQTERLDLPALHAPVPLFGAVGERPVLFADEAGNAVQVWDALESVSTPLNILIGPEGGFAPAEREQLRALPNLHPVTLGPRILRADTAAIAMLTLVQARVGDWR